MLLVIPADAGTHTHSLDSRMIARSSAQRLRYRRGV
jgi:hypothetical protein